MPLANREDPDQTPPFAASDLVLHCLPMPFWDLRQILSILLLELKFTELLVSVINMIRFLLICAKAETKTHTAHAQVRSLASGYAVCSTMKGTCEQSMP